MYRKFVIILRNTCPIMRRRISNIFVTLHFRKKMLQVVITSISTTPVSSAPASTPTPTPAPPPIPPIPAPISSPSSSPFHFQLLLQIHLTSSVKVASTSTSIIATIHLMMFTTSLGASLSVQFMPPFARNWLQMHEVAKSGSRAFARLVLPTTSLAEVGNWG